MHGALLPVHDTAASLPLRGRRICAGMPFTPVRRVSHSRRAETGPFPRSWRAGAWRQRVATPNERCRSTSWDHVAARVFNNSNARPEQGVLRRPHRSEGLYIEATVLLNVTINTKKLPGTVQRSGGPLLESSRSSPSAPVATLAWLMPAPGAGLKDERAQSQRLSRTHHSSFPKRDLCTQFPVNLVTKYSTSDEETGEP